MGLWNLIRHLFIGSSSTDINNASDNGCTVNPATGLPMVNGCGGVDAGRNPFGLGNHHDYTWSSCTDSSDSSSSWGDSCGSSWND